MMYKIANQFAFEVLHPVSAAPASLPVPARPGGLILLVSGMVCGFGLGALGLALWPAGQNGGAAAAPPVLPAPAAPTDAPQPEPMAVRQIDWPPLFGTLPPPPSEPEAIAPAEPEPAPLAALDVRLRGVALDDAGGWALIESGDGVVLVRPGSPLTADHLVAEILPDSVLIESREGITTLTFETAEVTETVASRVRTSLPRAIMTGVHDFDEMPMPVPPADYRPGPGFAGPDNR